MSAQTKIRAIDGHYTECRGYATTRCVTLPNTPRGRALAAEIVRLFGGHKRRTTMTTTTTTTRLDRATAYLPAVCALESGDYAYRDDGMRRWYVVSESDLESLCDYIDSDDAKIRRDAYSHWCAGTVARKATVEEMAEVES